MIIKMPNGSELVTENPDVINSLLKSGGVEAKPKKTNKKSATDVASAPDVE
nr:MAG TPA: hypothetical protein [Caudoviricetes sp.]